MKWVWTKRAEQAEAEARHATAEADRAADVLDEVRAKRPEVDRLIDGWTRRHRLGA